MDVPQSSISDSTEVSNWNNVYLDALRCVARFLNPWELAKMSLVCKNWYRLIRRDEYRALISFPFRKRYKLTFEQFDVLHQMMNKPMEKFKLVHGEVGSGKTWLGVSYMMHKYRDGLACSLGRPPKMHAMVIVPPTCVAQWSEFFEKYTDIPVLSNYDSSCFFMPDWDSEIGKYGIIICSNLTSGRVADLLVLTNKKIFILHDEAHNAIKANYHIAEEIVGFTASIESFSKKDTNVNIPWKIFTLSSQTLNSTLPPLEFVQYEPAGVRPKDAFNSLHYVMNDEKYISVEALDYMETQWNFGIGYSGASCKIGKKWIGTSYGARIEEAEKERQATAISIMLNIPRLRQMVAVATLVKSRGEKLIVFDIEQSYIPHMTLLLQHFGFDVYPFCTAYNPSGRVKLLEKFKREGDVLIGSINMLGEGHNITEANNIYFARYPKTAEEFNQAFGRCHRYPQKKTVYVHMVFSCQLEMITAGMALERKRTKLRKASCEEEIKELVETAKKHKDFDLLKVLTSNANFFYEIW